MKQYMFLCPYNGIYVGDMIKDKRYSTAMQVVGFDNLSCTIRGDYRLKVIEPFTVNNKIFNINQKKK